MAIQSTYPFRTILFAAFLIALTGCRARTAIVTTAMAPPHVTAKNGELDGVPFYMQRGVCKRETVWAEPKYMLEVDVLSGGKVIASRSMIIPRNSFLTDGKIKTLLEMLNTLSAARHPADLPNGSCPGDVKKQWESVSDAMRPLEKLTFCEELQNDSCMNIAYLEKSGDILRLVNSAKVAPEVDYTQVYYLNTLSPWNGTASVDTHLNADGTLGEGSVQRDDETWSTILTAVGSLAGDVTTFGAAKVTAAGTVEAARVTAGATGSQPLAITSFRPTESNVCNESALGWPMPDLTVDSPPANKPVGDPKPPDGDGKKDQKDKPGTEASALTSYKVSVTPVVYLHDHTEKDLNISSCTPAPDGVLKGSFTITKADDGGDKPASDAIKVSGQVTLPKPATSPK